MNGPDHYRRAEALLDQAANTSTPEARLGLATRAQAHATLAQVAATIEPRLEDYDGGQLVMWSEVLT